MTTRTYSLFIRVFLAVNCLFVGSIFYQFALEGGSFPEDLEWFYENLPRLRQFFGISVIFTVISFELIILSSMNRWVKILLMAMFCGVVMAAMSVDFGVDLQHHGMYNAILFGIVVPSLITIISLTIFGVKTYGFRKCCGVTLSIVGSLVFIASVQLYIGHVAWTKGLSNESLLLEWDNCTIVEPTFVWSELLTANMLTFWVGPNTCPHDSVPKEMRINAKNDQYFSELSPEGLLTIRCDPKQEPSYTVFPDDLEFNLTEKSQYQSTLLSRSKTIPYAGPVYVDTIAVLARCGKFQNLLTRSPRNKEAVDRVREFRKTHKTSFENYNVAVIFLDALSRRNFFRYLPKTAKFLEDLKDNPNSPSTLFQFFRYHSIATSTGTNLIGLTKGLNNRWEISRHETAIWEDYSDAGFVTSLSDDMCQDIDADYFEALSYADHRHVEPFCLPEYHNPYAATGIWTGPYSIRRRCLAGQHVHKYLFQYVQQFERNYQDVPYLSFSLLIEGHEGTSNVIRTVDGDLTDYLENKKELDMANTFVFLVSDHGLHMGLDYMVEAYAPRLENQLPTLFMLVPNSFLDKFPHMRSNLEGNEQKLITGFDIYQTFAHILQISSNVKLKERKFGSSLFGSLPNRTCDDVGIIPALCKCKS